MFSIFLPLEPQPQLLHEPAAKTRDPHVNFTTFENSVFDQKWTLVKLLGKMPGQLISKVHQSRFKN